MRYMALWRGQKLINFVMANRHDTSAPLCLFVRLFAFVPERLQKPILYSVMLICLQIIRGAAPVFALPVAQPAVKILYLEMDAKDAEILFRKEPQDDSSFSVVVVDKEQRMKGRVEAVGKTTRNFLKKSLLIKLDKGGGKWHGYRKISLNAMATDLSLMRVWLGWDMFAALGMVVPNVEHVQVYINKQFIGIFLFIEWIDSKMIDRFGFGEDGEFFHPDDSVYCANMMLINQPRLKECFLKLSPGGDYSSLYNLIEEINKTPVADFDLFLDKYFYADSMINWLILNTIIGNGDTYNKNYFLYHSKKTQKWIIIPWDFDLSFGRNSDPALPFPRNVINDNYQYFYPPEIGAPNPLKEKTLQNPKLLQRFRDRMSHVLGIIPELESGKGNKALGGFAWFRPDQFLGRLNGLEESIQKDLSRERYPGIKGPPFKQQVEALRLYNQWRHPLLKKLLLEPSPFDTPHWLPYTAYPPLTPIDPTAPLRRQSVPLFLTTTADIRVGDTPVVMMEEFLARPIGILDIQQLNRPARVRMEVETERVPASVPAGINPSKCIERTWHFDLKTPDAVLTVNIQVDYLQESSLRHELGSGIKEESGLSLWAFQNQAWHSLQTDVNPIANILKAEGVQLVSGNLLQLIACEK